MLTNLLNNTTSSISLSSIIILSSLAIILGLLIAVTHKYTSKYTKGFLTTISILPFLVEIVIMLVNGNLGTGVAIMGAFSLVRFRSMPGNAKEIATVFFAMVVGLTLGTGYALFAIIFTIVGCLFLTLYDKLNIFNPKASNRSLRIVVPEDLDYTEIFNDIFKKYTKEANLNKVKMIDMGSMFELRYDITLKDNNEEKKFIDELRVRNGNLKIILSHELEEGEL